MSLATNIVLIVLVIVLMVLLLKIMNRQSEPVEERPAPPRTQNGFTIKTPRESGT